MGTISIRLARGRFCRSATAFAVILLFAGLTGAVGASERRLELYNIHTKETISIVYKRDGRYDPDALKQLNHFMRDWRRDVSTEMDPELFDLIWEIHQELGSRKPVHIISGYRSPATNSMLRRTRGGQAQRSKHMTGQAADIHFPDISVKQLRNSALIRERGGVGYYPTSAIPFVHVDTGAVRHWPRLPRQELAILFPSGRSKHMPADGKPLTRQDFQVALANLQNKGGELPIALQRRLQGGEARTVLASLSPSAAPVPMPAKEPAPAEPKPQIVLAGLTPAFSSLTRPEPAERIERAPPSVARPPARQASAPADADPFKEDFLGRPPTETVAQDQIAAAPEYDDDHPDELYYQPFPITPFLTETPVASMDMTSGDALGLANVHVMFGEMREMYHFRFQPGLQYAQLYWAQRFRGTAVNTSLKRVAREDASQAHPAARAVRTAGK